LPQFWWTRKNDRTHHIRGISVAETGAEAGVAVRRSAARTDRQRFEVHLPPISWNLCPVLVQRLNRDSFFGIRSIGLPSDARQDASQWATAEFEQSFGWPGVFYTLDAALDARSRFFPNSNLVVIALGLPLRYRDAFVSQSTPSPPRPAIAAHGW
jgi:hypothetical protein